MQASPTVAFPIKAIALAAAGDRGAVEPLPQSQVQEKGCLP
ncbi:hypothetical protein [Halomicronema sp. CCY15110]|nr:hypothetical protein [Halomicronema sp. CCY15110]